MYYQLEYIDSATSRARSVNFYPFLLTSPRKFYLLSRESKGSDYSRKDTLERSRIFC